MRNAGKNVVSAHRGMTRLFYNFMGRFYDALYHRLIRGYVESAELLMKDLVREGDRVLDVGCGTGLLSYLALPQASHVVGVDIAFGMLKKAEQKRGDGQPVDFINGDALCLPFAGKFDCCVSAFMLVMLPRPMRWKVISEMERLLKPGGRIAFLTSRQDFGEQWMSKEEWRAGLKSLGLTGITAIDQGDVFLTIVAAKPAVEGVQELPIPESLRKGFEAEIVEEAPLGEGLPAWAS